MGGIFSPGQPKAAIPQDLAGMRQQQIGLLQQLLGFPQGGGGAMGGLGPSGKGGNDPLARLQQFFGTLGSPQTDLQRQTGTGISQYLNQPAPEQRALDVAMPGLQEILSGGGPQFERDLALANQQGGRFGSANAILRGEALKNLYNQRGQAAQTLGLLSSNAGQNPFSRLLGAGQYGQAQAGQADIETQRRLSILLNLLGVGQQASFNVPTTQSPSPFSQFLGLANTVANFVPGNKNPNTTTDPKNLGGGYQPGPPGQSSANYWGLG